MNTFVIVLIMGAPTALLIIIGALCVRLQRRRRSRHSEPQTEKARHPAQPKDAGTPDTTKPERSGTVEISKNGIADLCNDVNNPDALTLEDNERHDKALRELKVVRDPEAILTVSQYIGWCLGKGISGQEHVYLGELCEAMGHMVAAAGTEFVADYEDFINRVCATPSSACEFESLKRMAQRGVAIARGHRASA